MIEYMLSMFILLFGAGDIIFGFFTAYFGSDRSRMVGATLIIVGLIVIAIFLWGAGLVPDAPDIIDFSGVIVNSLLAILGALLGFALALVIFLVAIMERKNNE